MGERGIGENAPNIELIETIADNSPYKADAFIAALVSIRTSAILCAAWRIIQGVQIDELKVDFKRLNGFCLRLTLPSPSGQPEQYESTDIDDLSFVRHLIKSKSENRPMINGFHALRMSRS